ncbi:MAG: serine-type D-Ala-D-Ala carboxypeptidase [Candidatus Sumerlaeota bacterium]|nr:serine-type D-Ala-D-Ala carboxypeptidase [Candidatus Sumerlaeota bacterium]
MMVRFQEYRSLALRTAAVVALALSSLACAKAPEVEPLPAEIASQMEQKVLDAIAKGVMPGAVLAVGHDGVVLEERAIGNKALNPDVPMTTDTVFDLASVSKVVGTATATMLLIEDGKMTLDTRVADILPQFAEHDKGDVRIRDLMTHSSGLKPYENWKTAEAIRNGGAQSDALVNRIASLEKQYPTAEYYNYSCLNFLTLARLNEIVAGESQESLLRRRVWQPLGMNDTAYVLRPDMVARWAPTFAGSLPEGRQPGSTHDPLAFYYGSTPEHCPGNAGLFSTVHDLEKYCQMILNEGELNGVRVFKPETIRLMTGVHAALPDYKGRDANGNPKGGEITQRGLGWGVYSSAPYTHPDGPAGSWVGHTGYTGTYLWLDMNKNAYVLLLANSVYSKDPPVTTPTRRAVTGLMVDYLYGSGG